MKTRNNKCNQVEWQPNERKQNADSNKNTNRKRGTHTEKQDVVDRLERSNQRSPKRDQGLADVPTANGIMSRRSSDGDNNIKRAQLTVEIPCTGTKYMRYSPLTASCIK